MFNRLKHAGFNTCIDRFGTGQLPITTLQQLQVDMIKIDRTLVENMHLTKQAENLLKAILVMCHAMEIPVIATGIETEEQKAFLMKKGCDGLQGHLLQQPAPINTIKG